MTNYVARRWQHLSHGAVQYRVEKDKNDQLIGEGMKQELEEGKEESREEQGGGDEVEPSPPKRQRLTARAERRLKSERRSGVEEKPEVEEALAGPSSPGAEEQETPIHISISSGFQLHESPKKRKEKLEGRSETFRQLRRANTIIEAVRSHGVVDDPTKLYKMIQEQEVQEGYEAKMDKKSLMRLLSKLGREGQIKNIRVVFRHDQKSKTLHFVCNPEVSEDNTIIQSAIEQAKMKFNIPPRTSAPVKPESEFLIPTVSESLAAMQELEQVRGSPMRSTKPSSQRHGRRYGLQPKFVKMRELHQLLFYLIHGYQGQEELEQEAARGQLRSQGLLAEQEEQELQGMRLYQTEVGWSMFLPPLPSHQGWPLEEGWCLMCDILLRLPLSLFVRLVNITFEVPGLQEYLAHPVRRHYLIRALPQGVRNKLLFQVRLPFLLHPSSSYLLLFV